MKIYINCKYRDRIVVPYWAISPNWDWHITPDNKKKGTLCLMKDGILAEVVMCETKTVFEFEDVIREIYKTEPYEFLKKWYQASKGMISKLYLCHIYLKKHETKEKVENGVSEED